MRAISIELLLAQVCAVTFFRAGRIESDGEAYDYRFPWALMSALVLGVFKMVWPVLLLSQVGLFLALACIGRCVIRSNEGPMERLSSLLVMYGNVL